MSPKSMSTVLRYLRHLVSDTEGQGESDLNLLRRYVSQRDEQAWSPTYLPGYPAFRLPL